MLWLILGYLILSLPFGTIGAKYLKDDFYEEDPKTGVIDYVDFDDSDLKRNRIFFVPATKGNQEIGKFALIDFFWNRGQD